MENMNGGYFLRGRNVRAGFVAALLLLLAAQSLFPVFSFALGPAAGSGEDGPAAYAADGADADGANDANGAGGLDGAAQETQIEDEEVPLGILPSFTTWAFANFIIALVCMIVSVTVLVVFLTTGRKTFGRREPYLSFALAGACMGVVALAAFLLTEDMHSLMVTYDGFTALMLVIFAAQMAFLALAFRNARKKEDSAL
jgi:hypothetical protein